MLISICIPTYNSGAKLERLLDSIRIQSFTGYEIVISDDSTDNGVKEIIDQKYHDMGIRYYHNDIPLGTPANWNNALSKIKGDWIKMMHHDDWFMDENALQVFVDHIGKDPAAKLIFCAFKNINTDNDSSSAGTVSVTELFLLKQNYLNLYKNFIGNPSCTLVSSALMPYEYDKRIKWLIDFDFYTWYFQKEKKFIYINKPLIAFRIHSGQVTAQSQKNPAVEIPESFLLIEKYGIGILKNIFVYDFFWRMYRNLGIRSIAQLEGYLGHGCNYQAISDMISWQNKLSLSLLQKGYLSKPLMGLAYLNNKLHKN
ncbi:MAG: glycosyltransferase family 2 protein [Ferruginibacter sp.]